MAVHSAVGDLINFYNVGFYKAGDTQYDTYEQIFVKSSGSYNGTALT